MIQHWAIIMCVLETYMKCAVGPIRVLNIVNQFMLVIYETCRF